MAQAILKDATETARYKEVIEAIRFHGIAEEVRHFCALSKLFGWPSLVQLNDVDQADTNDPKGYRLLLQIDEYCDGKEAVEFGDGGSLYFMIEEPNLRKHRFDRCELEMQCA